MNIISIDDRLKSIANMINNYDCIADIGTDHGYLPIYLIQTNKVNKAYASDIAIGPLNKAIENIKKYQLENQIQTILCSGVDKIPNDANCIIMAGMGGNLIANLISERKYDFPEMILQPNLHVDILRKAIIANNYQIVDETVTYAHKKYYEIIKIKKGQQTLDENQIKFGPINLIKKEALFIDKWSNELNKFNQIILSFKGNADELKRLSLERDNIANMLKSL